MPLVNYTLIVFEFSFQQSVSFNHLIYQFIVTNLFLVLYLVLYFEALLNANTHHYRFYNFCLSLIDFLVCHYLIIINQFIWCIDYIFHLTVWCFHIIFDWVTYLFIRIHPHTFASNFQALLVGTLLIFQGCLLALFFILAKILQILELIYFGLTKIETFYVLQSIKYRHYI